MQRVVKTVNGQRQTVEYRYDGTGNRVMKVTSTKTTYYVRDASGNVMAIYEKQAAQTQSTLIEQPIYGSSRIGMYIGKTKKLHRTLGNKIYELSNHLGNILATITDANTVQCGIYQTNGSPAKVISGTDYYAFGAAMPSRSYQDAAYSKYRYGFNNMEKDEETGTHHFKYREDDQDAGRFWSVDPLAAQYPWNSPYAFAENDVIRSIDLEGTEKLSFHLMSNYRANQLKIFTMRDIAPRQVLSEVMRYSAIEFSPSLVF